MVTPFAGANRSRFGGSAASRTLSTVGCSPVVGPPRYQRRTRRSRATSDLLGHPAELVGVADEVEAGHLVAVDAHRRDRCRARRPAGAAGPRWPLTMTGSARLSVSSRGDRDQEAEHLLDALDRAEGGLLHAAAVGDQHDVGGEHVHQALQVTGGDRRHEPLDHRVALRAADHLARAAGRRRGCGRGARSGVRRRASCRRPRRSRRRAGRRPRAARTPPARSASASRGPGASRSRRCRRARRPRRRPARSAAARAATVRRTTRAGGERVRIRLRASRVVIRTR